MEFRQLFSIPELQFDLFLLIPDCNLINLQMITATLEQHSIKKRFG